MSEAKFWIRRDDPGDFTIDDLTLTIGGNGDEVEILSMFDPDEIVNSDDLESALSSGEVTRIDGQGGSVVPYAKAFRDLKPVLDLPDDSTKFLNGEGAWTVPDGGSGSVVTVFVPADHDSDYGNRRVQKVLSNNAFRFNMFVPEDFGSLVSVHLIGISDANLVSANIDLDSDYAKAGENYKQHTETDHSITYSATQDQITHFDVSSVFSNLEAGDDCGLKVDHKSIGASVYYIGMELRYNKA